MKLAVVVGWILFGLELLLALGFIFRRTGTDATGSAIARDVGMVMIPLLLVVGGLFVWGQRGGPRSAFWIGWGIICLPLIVAAYSALTGGVRGVARGVGRYAVSRFPDAKLNALGSAIENADTAKVASLVREGGLDWAARNGYGKSAFALAVDKACEYGAPREAVEIVRTLLGAGAFPIGTTASDSARLGEGNDADALVWAAFGSSNGRPNAVEVLDLLLSVGGDPNARDRSGQPMHYSTYRSMESLEVLARHKADFTVKDTTYEDRKDRSPAAWAIGERDLELTLFLLEHGVSPDQDDAGGKSARVMLKTLESEAATDPRYRRLKRLIDATPHGGFIQREPPGADSVGT